MLAPEVKDLQYLKDQLKIDSTQRGSNLYIEAYRKLRKLIVSGYYKNGDKFLSEAELASIMGIGRTSLRTAFVLLYEDGYLKTYQGKGTYVVYEPSKADNLYHQDYLLPKERLEKQSDTIHTIFRKTYQLTYDEFLDTTLDAKGEELSVLQCIYSLDGQIPAVFTNFYFPRNLMQDISQPADAAAVEERLSQVFHEQVKCVLCTFTPAPSGLSRQIPNIKFNGNNFILVSSTWLNYADEPLVYTKDHYNGDCIKFRVRFQK